jgi:hypothetical protein
VEQLKRVRDEELELLIQVQEISLANVFHHDLELVPPGNFFVDVTFTSLETQIMRWLFLQTPLLLTTVFYILKWIGPIQSNLAQKIQVRPHPPR